MGRSRCVVVVYAHMYGIHALTAALMLVGTTRQALSAPTCHLFPGEMVRTRAVSVAAID